MIKKTNVLWPVSIAGILLLGVLFSLQLMVTSAYAQDPDGIAVVKVLNQTSPLVRVGQDISFTIYITNNAGFTLTHANLFDDYEEAILGNFGMVGDPPPSTVDTAAGELIWTNLISNPATGSYFSPLADGDTISLTIRFQVQHPPPTGGFAIVNRAQIRDAVFAGGGDGSDGAVVVTTAPITGGRAPIYKQLNPPPQMPNIGDRITYTVAFTNEGAAAITETTVTDSYNPAYLLFITATPTAPTMIDPVNGVITWTNLATPPVQPGQFVSVTVVFEILQVGLINNRAEMVRVLDYFGNDLSPGFDQVGITIIDDTPETAPTPTREDDEDDDEEEAPTATATPFPTQTPVAITTTTTTTGPLYLPETGWRPNSRFAVPILGLLLLAAGWTIVRRHNRT